MNRNGTVFFQEDDISGYCTEKCPLHLEDVSLSTLVIDLQGNISSTGKDLALAKRFFLERKVMKKGNVSKSLVQALETK
jgi:hypothetical protein